MTTDELVTADQDTSIDALARFDADTCERRARAIIARLGEPVSFEDCLWT